MPERFDKLAGYQLETFEGLVGEIFVFDNQFQLELVEACASRSQEEIPTAKSKLRPPFSLLFASCQTEILSTGTHEVWHQSLGQFPLAINPVQLPIFDRSGENDLLHYESIFA